jgi:hypothetical protein
MKISTHIFKTNGLLHNLRTAFQEEKFAVFQKKVAEWHIVGAVIFVIILKYVLKITLYLGTGM